MLAELFTAFLIYSVGFISGMLVFPCMANVLLKMLKGRMKR